MLFEKRTLPARVVTIWPGAAVTGPVMSSVAPLEANKPPAKVVFWTKIGPESVPTPEEAERKIAPWPTTPVAYLILIGLAMLTPWSSWNWPVLIRLTTLVLAPKAPVASTRKTPAAPPMLTGPVKSLAGLLTMSVPGPTLVRPMLPVIFEATVK